MESDSNSIGTFVALGDPGNPSITLDEAERVACSVESVGTLENPIRRL